MQPGTVVLRHPTDLCLDVVVTPEMAAVLKKFGYTEVNEPADELPDEKEGKADGNNDVFADCERGSDGG